VAHPHINGLCLLMIHGILIKFNGALIVTKESGESSLRKTQLVMKRSQPGKVLTSKDNPSMSSFC
jgi:hypothetical protein